MNAMDLSRKVARPLAVGALLAVSVISLAQGAAVFNGKVKNQNSGSISQSQSGSKGNTGLQGKVLSQDDLYTKTTRLGTRSGKVSQGGLIVPRNFFPMVNNAPSPKTVKPENPSRHVPPSSIVFDNGGRPPLGGTGGKGGGGATTLGGTNGTKANSGSKFPGIGFTGSFPPDTSAAVGPDYIVEVVNSSIGFFRKSDGNQVFLSTFDSGGFLAGTGVGDTPFAFDPRVVYDKEAGRFYALILDVDFENEVSSVIVCVSTTSNPLDPWVSYRLDNTFENDDSDLFWGDYPQIGFNNDLVVISVNYFAFDDTVPGTWASFMTLDKDPLLAGVNVTPTFIDDFNAFTARPTRLNGVSNDPAYAVSFIGSSGTSGVYRTYSFEEIANATVANAVDVVVANNNTGINAPSAPGPGFFLDTIGGRLMDATHANNRVAFARTVGVSGTGGNKAGIAWAELEMNNFPNGTPTVNQGAILAESGNFHAYQPALELNANGDMSLIYTRSSTTRTPEVMVAVRKSFDAPGTLSASTVVATSANYSGVGFPFPGRWGDYASVSVDPNDDTIFWGCNEIGAGYFANFFETDWDTVIVSWQIPAGQSGTDLSPDAVTNIYGSTAGGSLASFNDVDDDMYALSSESIAERGEYAAYELTFQSPETKENTERIDVIVNARVSGMPTAGYMYVYNNATGRWDLRRTFRCGSDLTQASFRVSSGAQVYADDNGVIRVRIMAFQALRRRGGTAEAFTFSTDDVSMNVNAG